MTAYRPLIAPSNNESVREFTQAEFTSIHGRIASLQYNNPVATLNVVASNGNLSPLMEDFRYRSGVAQTTTGNQNSTDEGNAEFVQFGSLSLPELISGGVWQPASATTLEGSVTRREMRAAPTIGATAALKAEDPSVTVYTQSSALVSTVQADAFSEKMQLKNFSGLSTQRPYFLRNPAAGSGHITLEAEL